MTKVVVLQAIWIEVHTLTSVRSRYDAHDTVLTGCVFPRKPFAGLANKHMLTTLENMTGMSLPRPRALPKRESFSVSVARNFETGLAEVVVQNTRTGEQAVLEGPMLEVPALTAEGMQQVWGILNPPPSYHVSDWDNLA